MFLKLFLLFTIIPFAEVILLIKLGTIIGSIYTIMLIISTGIIGAFMVRMAGLQCLFRIQNNLSSGILPADELFSGVLILLAGAFLITPGLITDTLGFCLVFQPTREIIKKYLKSYFKSRIDQNNHNNYY